MSRFVDVLPAALLLAVAGCTGSLIIDTPAAAPDDDDDVVADDDDAVDDDDALDDDDAAEADYSAYIGYFVLVTGEVVGQPYAGGWGYFYEELDQGRGPNCEVQLPDGGGFPGDPAAVNGPRGPGALPVDAGAWARFYAPNGQWDMEMPRYDNPEWPYYWANGETGAPPIIPSDIPLSLQWAGGSQMLEGEAEAVMYMHPEYRMDSPTLPPDQERIVAREPGDLVFEWTPGNAEAVEIAMYFVDQQNGREWQVTCETADDGFFHFDAEDWALMPTGTPGATWIRRYLPNWTEAIPGQPNLYLVGAREYRWPLAIEAPQDGDDDDDDDPNQDPGGP